MRLAKNHYIHMQIRIEVLRYADTVNNRIRIPFIYIYIYINSPKRRRFKLCISYIYIRLIGCIAFSCNAWAKRQK
jgi:hypothetical protein